MCGGGQWLGGGGQWLGGGGGWCKTRESQVIGQ